MSFVSVENAWTTFQCDLSENRSIMRFDFGIWWSDLPINDAPRIDRAINSWENLGETRCRRDRYVIGSVCSVVGVLGVFRKCFVHGVTCRRRFSHGTAAIPFIIRAGNWGSVRFVRGAAGRTSRNSEVRSTKKLRRAWRGNAAELFRIQIESRRPAVLVRVGETGARWVSGQCGSCVNDKETLF